MYARNKFEKFSILAKSELESLNSRQSKSFQKNFSELAKFEIEQSKVLNFQ